MFNSYSQFGYCEESPWIPVPGFGPKVVWLVYMRQILFPRELEFINFLLKNGELEFTLKTCEFQFTIPVVWSLLSVSPPYLLVFLISL